MNGVLGILKPPGPSSHEVVARLRRITGLQRIGHGGTLDPAAAGVLPICLGAATRLSPFLHLPPKTYRFLLVLGETTPTLDQTAPVTTRVPAGHLRATDLEALLNRFRGPIQQRVPVFSARKQHGTRRYAYARRGIAVEPLVATCTVHRLELLAWQSASAPLALCQLECSAGTYVRALCADLGDALGVGGHMGALVRTRAAGLEASACLTLEEVEACMRAGDLPRMLRAPAEALWFLPSLCVVGEEARAVCHGRPPGRRVAADSEDGSALPATTGSDEDGMSPPPTTTGFVRLLDADGRLLAVAERQREGRIEGYRMAAVLASPE